MSHKIPSGDIVTRNPVEAGAELKRLRLSMGISQSELGRLFQYCTKTVGRWERGELQPRELVLQGLRRLSNEGGQRRTDGSGFTFIDLFAGIGGLRLGFQTIGGKCVFTSEWDKHCQITYRTNFGSEHPIAGDILQIPSELIPTHDVLLAGFPCQPFSIAGVSKKNALGRPHGFACETQGTLFFEVARILRHHRPKAFLLENVKNLVTHDAGRTFKTILNVLKDELGYDVHWKVLDARRVVPQHRERIFIVGFREPTAFDWGSLRLPPMDDAPRLRAILHPEDGSEIPEPPFTEQDGKVSRKYILSSHLWRYLRNYAEKHKKAGNGFGFGLVTSRDVARTLSARYYKDGSEILVKRGSGNPRRLTPRECARLMGFDRPGRPPFAIPVSDTQAYKQFGNSVVVPLVEAVARAMKPHLTPPPVTKEQLTLALDSTLA